jgi:sugar phosphate isomerase/epimerase
MSFDRLNDGSQNAPRLRVGHTLWGLRGLPMNAEIDGKPEWTIDEKFARCKAAGFESIECSMNSINDQNEQEIREALRRHDLKAIIGHHPFSIEETQTAVDTAVRWGADFVVDQAASAFTPLAEVVDLVNEGRRIANKAGIPLFVEVHRNNFTETIPQTLQLLEAAPNVRITGDFSHFVVVGEFYGWEDEGAADKMDAILRRVSHLHGRISNGEAVQVDVGDGSGQTAQFFVEIWSRAMRYWLAEAEPGDVFQFSSELGPPRYAITLPDGREFSDRWEQSLVIKKLAQQAWQKALGSA